MLAREAEKFDIQFSLTQKQLSSHEQYGRRENLEIHGIPIQKNDIPSQIIETVVAKSLNVLLDESHILTSHRLSQSDTTFAAGNPITQQQQGRIKTRHQSPPIIVRFTDRDKRNQIFRRKILLNGNNAIKSVVFV